MGTIRNPWEKVRLDSQVLPMSQAVSRNSARATAEATITQTPALLHVLGNASGAASSAAAEEPEACSANGPELVGVNTLATIAMGVGPVKPISCKQLFDHPLQGFP